MLAPSIIVALALLAAGLAVGWRRSAHRLRRATEERISASDQREAESAAREQRLAATLGAAPLGAILVDRDGEIVFTNELARRYVEPRFGDAAAETPLRDCAAEALANDIETMREVELYTPTRRVLRVLAVPLHRRERPTGGASPPLDGGGAAVEPITDVRIDGVAVFLEDLTERHRIDAMRKDFVANASHELKTPLGAVSVLAEALADADDAATRLRLAGRLSDETRRMARLINDILDLAIVEGAGIERLPVVMDDVVAEAHKLVAAAAEEAGITVEIGTCAEASVAGDHGQLVSAVSNLLDNAIKYTPAGDGPPPPVRVEVRCDAETVTVTVTDRGIGIPEQHQPRIFERFYRVDRARSRRTGGTGLGLAIVRHVVRNHAGTIEVESEPGSGSTFRLVVPRWSD